MIDETTTLYDSEEIRASLRDIGTVMRGRGLRSGQDQQISDKAVSRLRIAAFIAFDEMIGNLSIDEYLRDSLGGEMSALSADESTTLYRTFHGYIEILLATGERITLDDLLYYCASGLLATKPTEVRATLRQAGVRLALERMRERAASLEWAERLRNDIGVAALYLLRQQTHQDVRTASDLIQQLGVQQRVIEAEWLEERPNPRHDAILLLGLYHLAQAVKQTSAFLLNGTMEAESEQSSFEFELRRLLVRSEEYLGLCNDPDVLSWLVSISIILWSLYQDSIWVSGVRRVPGVRLLLERLVAESRDTPIFSLMPSQKQAIRDHLLDPARVAVVLQMPTSSGKTLLAEFAIVQAVQAHQDRATRIVYVTSTRALTTQMRRTLAEDLRPLGIGVAGASSAFEEDPYELNLLEEEDCVIVTTPEKLDLLLRSRSEWFSSLRLIIVDEAHLIGDRERGSRLELLLANIRREHQDARLLLLTPFIENAMQIAQWLGGPDGLPISVHWRPSNVLLGLARVAGAGQGRNLTIRWKDPYGVGPDAEMPPTIVPTTIPSAQLRSVMDRVVFLSSEFEQAGTILALCASSRSAAEQVAMRKAEQRAIVGNDQMTPALRLAIAFARDEYGPNSLLATCLERKVAFHHSALSPMLRYLVEDQVRCGEIDFLAATTTLAQGMNFPVATILIHSIAKPRGGGSLTAPEFWNIAGRAGRVNMVDKGTVVFADSSHQADWEHYAHHLSGQVLSALLQVLPFVNPNSIYLEYRKYPELRPFIQYLAHAAANGGVVRATRILEQLVQASLANVQVETAEQSAKLRGIARAYFREIQRTPTGFLKTADSTGLGTFSFNSILRSIDADTDLLGGPQVLENLREDGMYKLINVLRYLPEINLSLDESGEMMGIREIARVVQGWIDGKAIYEMAAEVHGTDQSKKIRDIADYVYRRVTQNVSWGAYAYVRGWLMRTSHDDREDNAGDRMLPAYIQYGVRTPEAVVASLLNVPRQLAEAFAAVYRNARGPLPPHEAFQFKQFIEAADIQTWQRVVSQTGMQGTVRPEDARTVWRQMQGLNPE